MIGKLLLFLIASLILSATSSNLLAQKLNLSGSVGNGGTNHQQDVLAVQRRLIKLGFRWLKTDGKAGPKTVAAIQLFQSIKAGRRSVGGDGRVDIGGDTQKWLEAKNAPRWTKMSFQGTAYKNIELLEKHDDHDYGTNWLDDTIQSAAADYQKSYRKKNKSSMITVNDASPAIGGDTPDHKGHETGLDVDLRLPQIGNHRPSPGGRTFRSKDYDQGATRAILKSFAKQPLVDVKKVYFNDPVLIKEGLCQKSPGHDNHIHVSIRPPKRKSLLPKQSQKNKPTPPKPAKK